MLPLAPAIDPVLDPLVIRATHALKRLVAGPPFRIEHARQRERALADVLSRREAEIVALGPAVRRRDREAIARFDAAIAAALDDLRGDAEARAAATGAERLAHAVDRLVHANTHEWLDDPGFDERLRVRTLERLDRMNEALGSYDAFFAAIEPVIARARAAGVARPTIVDLASGHAMFAVAMALRFGAREGLVRVVATDLAPEYLGIGRARARELAIPEHALSFVPHDALDLRDLPAKVGSPIDVVTCTQTLHHFPPGMVARLFAEASSAARHGAVLVDGERNPFTLVTVAALSAALGRGSLPFLHDAFVSIRRMFTEQELALVGQLAPRADGEPPRPIERGWLEPGHVFVRSFTGTA
ncbi:MAG: methyltransferase domain-containing protein [Deltaproteobacteria bacterium]|nr:methyltransferase domain-containing protein [Deltaproteobacteria bacterium]